MRSSDQSDNAASAPAVRIQHVSKAFGKHVVLSDLNLEIATGAKVAIIGRSGSGKTTLLRIVMTLEKPDIGTIEVFGELLGYRRVADKIVEDTPSNIRKVRANVGMVFQHFNLFPHLTAVGNVMAAPMYVRRLQKDVAHQQALELLDMVGLAAKANSYPRQLSGGQQQRVAIARALAMHPRIMLFDEVTSALDPELVGEVLVVIRRLAQQRNMTMLIVTHEMTFARDIADRVLFMDEGSIVEDAPPGTIFTAPANERTRLFLRAVLER